MSKAIFSLLGGPAQPHLMTFVQNGDGQGELYRTDEFFQPTFEQGAVLTVRRSGDQWRFVNRASVNVASCSDLSKVVETVERVASDMYGEDTRVQFAVRKVGDLFVSICPLGNHGKRWVIRPYAKLTEGPYGPILAGGAVILSNPARIVDRYPSYEVYVLTDDEEITVRD